MEQIISGGFLIKIYTRNFDNEHGDLGNIGAIILSTVEEAGGSRGSIPRWGKLVHHLFQLQFHVLNSLHTTYNLI